MKPVFVDRSGRRRRLVRAAGTAAGLALALASALLVAGFTGAGPDHLPLLPDPAGGRIGNVPASARPSVTPAPAPPSRSAPPSGQPTSRAPSSAVPATTAAPTPSRTNHRRVPTHTPGNKPSKPS
ncbi:hypothetical protein [Phytohabitans houttuyneae]|uniref:Uncharacterized protein n=1 Tax=Phytohabitans houttuyneae TaxID=1076126 RepID=A0A6V8KNF9_9ACTN|nr:hypothetical protein [Phytohabitans houttuyneae]GFJ83297.1 hypothetical protein Phou_074770 [Phytohabitans houttuyneae]